MTIPSTCNHFVASSASPQSQRAATPLEQHASFFPYADLPRSITASEGHAESAYASCSYGSCDGRQGSDAAVSESNDSSVTMAGDESIGGTASRGASPTYEPASSIRLPASPTHESPFPAHDGVAPNYDAVTQGTAANTLYTQLDQWDGWPVRR